MKTKTLVDFQICISVPLRYQEKIFSIKIDDITTQTNFIVQYMNGKKAFHTLCQGKHVISFLYHRLIAKRHDTNSSIRLGLSNMYGYRT